jgi:protoheme IX farnesyltransferase
MVRTANRPLPEGRISQREAAWFGVILSVLGAVCLLFTVNGLATSIAVLSSVLYAGIYTPLKRHTALNTVVGAIPGALPPVIGWAAVTGEVSTEAWVLFLIVFLWQFPHFFAIAWLYRNDYEAAGLKMLPTSELGRRMTGIQVISYTLALIAVSLVPTKIGMAGPLYFWGALALGAHFFIYGLRFMAQPGDRRAKALMMASLVYLPMLLSLMAVDLIR